MFEGLALGNVVGFIESFSVLNLRKVMGADIFIITFLELFHDFRELVSLPFNDFTKCKIVKVWLGLVLDLHLIWSSWFDFSVQVIFFELWLVNDKVLNFLEEIISFKQIFRDIDMFH